MAKITGELNHRERTAIDEYFKNGFSKSKALRTAGYTGTSLMSGTIFGHPAVKKEMARREKLLFASFKRTEKKLNITEERIVKEYCLIAFAPLEGSPIGMELERVLLSDGLLPLPEGVTKGMSPVSAKDKKAALDSLAKWKGMFIERIEITGDAEVIKRLNEGRQQARLKAAPEPVLEDAPDTVTLKEGEDGLFE